MRWNDDSLRHGAYRLKMQERTLEYRVDLSARAKRMRITVYSDGTVVLIVPRRANIARGHEFLATKVGWILDRVDYFQARRSAVRTDIPSYDECKASARALVEERLAHFNFHYRLGWDKVTIRNQRTLWGSATSKKTLNFNYKVVLLPPHLADYVVVHELCHLKEMNHSMRFWKLVEQTIPNAKNLRRELRSTDLQV